MKAEVDETADAAKFVLAAGELRTLVERIEAGQERAKDERAAVAEIFAEAKSRGYDPKVLRKLVALRAKAAEERLREEAILDAYLAALGG